MNYFEVRCKCTRIDEKGKEKKVSESYLVQDEVFAGAEQFMQSELQARGGTDHEIKGISIQKYADVVTGVGDKFYKCKIRFESVDEQTGKKKVITSPILHHANNIDDANKLMSEYIQQFIVPVEIVSITESKIIECYLAK